MDNSQQKDNTVQGKNDDMEKTPGAGRENEPIKGTQGSETPLQPERVARKVWSDNRVKTYPEPSSKTTLSIGP